MKTIKIYEVGDTVSVTPTKAYALCTTNEGGGTQSCPVGDAVVLTVKKTWVDDEIGRRYIGADSNGKEFYFGDFYSEVELIEGVNNG